MRNKFVVVVVSYNNEAWCVRNIESILNQKFLYFRIVFVNDASTDKTGSLVWGAVNKAGWRDRFAYVENMQRMGHAHNWYYAINWCCADDEIVVQVDGDDWLAHDGVLEFLDRVYNDDNVWITYGQYMVASGGLGQCAAFPPEILNGRFFRRYEWVSSHLRTFRAFLFKKIKPADFKYVDGRYFEAAVDQAMMLPMLEMAGATRIRFISDVLYIYNLSRMSTPLHREQPPSEFVAKIVRERPSYALLKDVPHFFRCIEALPSMSSETGQEKLTCE